MEYLKCNLCNKTSNDLTSLSCNHRTCDKCFYKLFLFNEKIIVNYSNEKEKGEIGLKCLICYIGTIKVTKDFIPQKLYGLTGNSKEIQKCSGHNKENNIFCNGCKANMCIECFNSHKNVPFFASHQRGEDPVNSEVFDKCILHNNLLYSYFCSECHQSLCEMCKSCHKKEHKIHSAKDFYNQMKDDLKSQFGLPASDDRALKELDMMDQEFKNEINKNVSDLKDKIHCIIDQLEETCTKLDQEQESIFKEIDINNKITKTLFNYFNRDLENTFKSPDFDFNSIYLSKINSEINFGKNLLNNYMITKAIKDIKDIIETYQVDLENKRILQINQINRDFTLTQTLTGHSSYVHAIIQLKNDVIASCSADNTIKIWNTNDNFNCVHTLNGHKSHIFDLTNLKDGRIASGSYDSTIKIWDPQENFKCSFTLTEHSSGVSCVIQLKNGTIASGSYDKTIKIWDPKKNFQCIQTLTGHTEYIWRMVQLQDGRIASGSGDKSIKIWNPPEYSNYTHNLNGHTAWVGSIIQLRNGKLASSSGDNTIILWDPLDNFKNILVLTGHNSEIRKLIELRDGRMASCSVDKTIKFWNPDNNYNCCWTLDDSTDNFYSLLQLRDCRIASGSSDGKIKIYE